MQLNTGYYHFQHWPCYSKASVLEARMRTCMWRAGGVTHFEVCLEPYSSQTVSLTFFVKKQKLLEMPCDF